MGWAWATEYAINVNFNWVQVSRQFEHYAPEYDPNFLKSHITKLAFYCENLDAVKVGHGLLRDCICGKILAS